MHFAKTIDKRSYFKTSVRAQILISDHLTKRQIKLSIFSAFYFNFFLIISEFYSTILTE